MRIIFFTLFIFLFACKQNTESLQSLESNNILEDSVESTEILQDEAVVKQQLTDEVSDQMLVQDAAQAIDEVQEKPEDVSQSDDVSNETKADNLTAGSLDVSNNAQETVIQNENEGSTPLVQENVVNPPEPDVINAVIDLPFAPQAIDNRAPIATDDVVEVPEDRVVLLENLLNNDHDLDGDDLKIIQFSQASLGVVVFINKTKLKYIPFKDFNGADQFSYTISDESGAEAVAQVNIKIKSVNDSPIAKPDSFFLSQGKAHTINVIANDEGLGDGIKLSIKSQPENGKISILKYNKLRFTANGDFFGQDSFVYQLKDADGEISIATVKLDVECFDSCTRVFNVSWDPSVSFGVTDYRVYVGTVANQLDKFFDIGNFTNFDYYASQKGEYFFAISAFNAEGIESELSQIIKGVF